MTMSALDLGMQIHPVRGEMFIERSATPPPAPFEGAAGFSSVKLMGCLPLLRTEPESSWVQVYKHFTPN